MPGPGYHHRSHHQPAAAAETRRRTSSNSPPRRAPHDTSPYGGYSRRRVGIPTPVRPRNTVPVLTPLRSTRNDSRPHSSSDSRPRVPAAAAADLLHHAYSTTTSHGRFLNPPPPASSNPFSNGPAMTARATGAAAEQTHTNARKVPSFEPSSQLRSRSSDWRAGGGGGPSSSPPGPGPTITTHRPSSAAAASASASGAPTSSHHHHHLLINDDETTNANGSGEATLFSFSNSPPHPMRTDIIEDRPEIHAPQPSRLKPWKDILATRSDMLGLDKPPPRPLQRPPVPRKDSPHQGA